MSRITIANAEPGELSEATRPSGLLLRSPLPTRARRAAGAGSVTRGRGGDADASSSNRTAKRKPLPPVHVKPAFYSTRPWTGARRAICCAQQAAGGRHRRGKWGTQGKPQVSPEDQGPGSRRPLRPGRNEPSGVKSRGPATARGRFPSSFRTRQRGLDYFLTCDIASGVSL